MPSNHLILYRPLLLPPSIFASIRVFFQAQAFKKKKKTTSFFNRPYGFLHLPELEGDQSAYGALAGN